MWKLLLSIQAAVLAADMWKEHSAGEKGGGDSLRGSC